MTVPRRGDIYLVEFDPARGHEIQKTRPAVVIQNDVSNRYSPITIVAAISSHFGSPPYLREVVLGAGARTDLSRPSAVILNQIRSIDRERLLKRIGRIDGETQQRVDVALKISLGLVEL